MGWGQGESSFVLEAVPPCRRNSVRSGTRQRSTRDLHTLSELKCLTMVTSRNLLQNSIAGLVFGIGATAVSAQTSELSQSQMRQLVADRQIIGAEQLVDGMIRQFDGSVIDIRGFHSHGGMIYRVLMQRADGAVVEVMIDGMTGQQVSHLSDPGQAIATAARSQRIRQSKVFNQTASRIGRSTSNGGLAPLTISDVTTD